MNTLVEIDYTNWKGERKKRTILPRPGGVVFEGNKFHPKPQWILYAMDVEKKEERGFAMENIHSWRQV